MSACPRCGSSVNPEFETNCFNCGRSLHAEFADIETGASIEDDRGGPLTLGHPRPIFRQPEPGATKPSGCAMTAIGCLVAIGLVFFLLIVVAMFTQPMEG